MRDIAIYGAGGFGREIACLIKEINGVEPTWNLIGFFDDGKEFGCQTEYGNVLGGIKELNKYCRKLSVAIAIGNPVVVSQLSSSICNPLVEFPNLISPSVSFLDRANFSIGYGNLVCSHCWISCNVYIGNFNVMNAGVTVGHDSRIGNFNSFMPAVRISGVVTIGECNFFGVSSVVLQQITIGRNTIIGANSLVIRKTKDGETYVGSPAVKVKY